MPSKQSGKQAACKPIMPFTGRFDDLLSSKFTQALNVTHGLNFATPCIKPAASCAAMTGCTSL